MTEKKLSPIQILRAETGDITTFPTCIVNAANESLLGGSGVDGAIHAAAGPELFQECLILGGCKTGEAKITKGYHLKADYVIHTPGPIYTIHKEPEKLLASCYRNCMKLAMEHDIHEIAFPAISTGVYGYPKEEAAKIATETVAQCLKEHPDYEMLVHFVCFGMRDYDIYEEILCEKSE